MAKGVERKRERTNEQQNKITRFLCFYTRRCVKLTAVMYNFLFVARTPNKHVNFSPATVQLQFRANVIRIPAEQHSLYIRTSHKTCLFQRNCLKTSSLLSKQKISLKKNPPKNQNKFCLTDSGSQNRNFKSFQALDTKTT